MNNLFELMNELLFLLSQVGEMFIVCGVLYAIDSTTERNTKIRLALDLYTSKLLDVSLAFTNAFRKTTTVGYNHRNKVRDDFVKGYRVHD